MRSVLLGIAAVLLAVLLLALLLLGRAHLQIRALHPALPQAAALLAPASDPDGPRGVYVIDTARQPMPRSAVLEPSLDPNPTAPYVMTHAAFVLVWPDGRLFLIDAGMDREAALAFGAPLERFAGAAPMEPLRSVADQLGPAAARVRGIAFTHLHPDHTEGLAGLCDAIDTTIPVFQTPGQHGAGNYTTRAGRAQLAAARCARPTLLPDEPLAAIPGFPGLFAIAAAGHTPGSQMLVARIRRGGAEELWIFTGDVVNQRDGVVHDVPKPWLYSLLVVPEDPAQLARLRHFLADLTRDPRVHLAIAHDASGLAASGAPPWPPSQPPDD